MTAYYNENDPYAAQWLRNLVAAGHIASGDVDERSIVDVRADDLGGYTQCHFFAGLAGWSYALRLAGWPDDRPVWTSSCPCQPFSAVGAGKAADDERHLWPRWFPLIRERRPAIVLGEQVEAAIGRGWLDLVFADLESQGYACGAAVLPACGVGAPHIRQRVWFVADADEGRSGWNAGAVPGTQGEAERQVRRVANGVEPCGTVGGVGDAGAPGLPFRQQQELPGENEFHEGRAAEQPSCSLWADLEWLPCTDGKARPVEPVAQQMADGLSRSLGRLCPEQKDAVIHASKSSGIGDEVLRALRRGDDATEVWQSLGRRLGFSEATVLFACLCEHSGQLGHIFNCSASGSSQEHQATLRSLRDDERSVASWPTPNAQDGPKGGPSQGSDRIPAAAQLAARSSYRWQPAEQQSIEFADALRKLSQEDAQFGQALASLRGFTGMPLAMGVPGRVGRLRAYGNAIVPQVAAEFIRAVM